MKLSKEYGSIVLLSFIRIMKNKDKYELIQKQFKKIYNGSNEIFSKVSSIEDMANKLYELSLKQFNEGKRFSNDEYEFITMLVNNTLHFIYEPICDNKSSLGLIGQEIFDLACYRIFGEKYLKDMNQLNNGAKRPETEEEAMLIGEYMALLNNGHNISWDDFLTFKKRKQNKKNVEHDEISVEEIMKYFKINV